MPPARERLEPDDLAVVEVHDRLVVGDDLPSLQRAPQIGLQPQRRHRALVHVAGEHLVAGAATRLGPVHRGVRVAQHVLGALVARARQRDADADAGEHLVAAHDDRRGQLLVDPLGHAGGVGLGVDGVEQHGELVAAQARQRVARPQAALEPARGPDQQLVAGLVAHAVIDRLEAIEIEVEQREQRIAQGAPRAVKQVLQAIEEQRAVRQRRQRIVERPPLKLLLRLLALADVARDAERADDVPLAIAQRQLRRRHPALVAVWPRLLLLDVDQRFTGADDLLLVAQRLRRVLVGEEVEVRAADRQRRIRDAEALRRIAVDAREAALAVLEVDVVGDVVHQRLEQEDLVLQLRNLQGRLPRARQVSDASHSRLTPGTWQTVSTQSVSTNT